MKKAAVLLFTGLAICGAAFAQEPKLFSVTVESVADPLYIRSFFGDYTEKTPKRFGDVDSPYLYQGNTVGEIKSFQSSGFANGITGNMGLSYNGQRLGGGLQLRARNDSAYGNGIGNRLTYNTEES